MMKCKYDIVTGNRDYFSDLKGYEGRNSINFFITHTGEQIVSNNILPSQINLQDIAHHLTKIQRYGGALPVDKCYSVAQHSILMCDYVTNMLINLNASQDDILLYGRAALLHDASEAYFGDLVTGLKCLLPDYKRLEEKLELIISHKYDLQLNDFDINAEEHIGGMIQKGIKFLDRSIVLDEALALLPERYNFFKKHNPGLKPLGVKIDVNEKADKIKQKFLDTCELLGVYDND